METPRLKRSIRSNLRRDSHARRKIEPESIPAIQAERAAGSSTKDIAAKYGVSTSTIQDIVAGRVWRGVGMTWGGDVR